MSLVALKGSERTLNEGAFVVRKANPKGVIQATIHIKPSGDRLDSSVRCIVEQHLHNRKHLSREEFAVTHGAHASDIQKVKRFTREYGLQLVADRLASKTNANPLGHRTVEVRGTIDAFNRALGVKMVRVRDQDKSYRTYIGGLSVPDAYQDVVRNVLGLDNRPQARPHSRAFGRLGGSLAHTGARAHTPDQFARFYNFPTNVTGNGQTVAIIELGGGYRNRDLRHYFQKLGMPVPAITAVPVSGRTNAPTGNPNGDDSEVMLDIEVAGAVANGATYVVYFGPNTNRGFFRTVNAAIHDNVHQPAIISISWGGPEGSWSEADMNSFNEAFQAAAAMGISIFVAAGDGGSTDDVKGSVPHADFPCSSPYATACGGTRLISFDGQTIASESVWNDGPSGGGGGGVSDVFDAQSAFYQAGSNVPPSPNTGRVGRGVPDIAGNADPSTGYKVRVDGIDTVFGGTSAVAPLWAGLCALMNESLGRSVGFLNPLLYSSVLQTPGALRDIVQGNNDTTGRVGNYPARPGWDACTGLGTPNGALILNALRGS